MTGKPDPTRCSICGERFAHQGTVDEMEGDDRAEMYSILWPDDRPAEMVHAECGLAKGWDVA